MNHEQHEEIDAMISQLDQLGVRPGGTLLVHSSVKSLGPIKSGLEGITSALLRALDGGTLLIPTLTYEYVDWENAVFDVLRTPSCVGALTEYFRKRDGVCRSLHLSHSVAGIGPNTDYFLSEHHLGTSQCGPKSPFSKVPRKGGQILMLGCGLHPNTSMHGIEELSEPPYLFEDRMIEYTAIDERGSRFSGVTRKHSFKGYRTRFDRIEGILKKGTELREGFLLQARCFLIEAEDLWEKGRRALLDNPLFFVERKGG